MYSGRGYDVFVFWAEIYSFTGRWVETIKLHLSWQMKSGVALNPNHHSGDNCLIFLFMCIIRLTLIFICTVYFVLLLYPKSTFI